MHVQAYVGRLSGQCDESNSRVLGAQLHRQVSAAAAENSLASMIDELISIENW